MRCTKRPVLKSTTSAAFKKLGEGSPKKSYFSGRTLREGGGVKAVPLRKKIKLEKKSEKKDDH